MYGGAPGALSQLELDPISTKPFDCDEWDRRDWTQQRETATQRAQRASPGPPPFPPLPRPSPGPISASGLSWHGLARRPTSPHSCSLCSAASVSRRWARPGLASRAGTPHSPASGALRVWHPAFCVGSPPFSLFSISAPSPSQTLRAGAGPARAAGARELRIILGKAALSISATLASATLAPGACG